MTYKVLDVRPMTKRIGAEIFNIDLTRPIDEEVGQELKNAIVEHQVLFFRDQPLDHESHKRLGRMFGSLVRHSGVKGIPNEPDIVAIHADAKSTWVAGEDWHTDLSYDAKPPMGSILYMHTIPDLGGDTIFTSMYAVYDALSPAMKAFLETLTAVHEGGRVYAKVNQDSNYAKASDTFAVTAHPIIKVHPRSGRKLLYVNPLYTSRIVELSPSESDAILKVLFEHIRNSNFQVRFRWQQHSIAFWDNRCTQHFAVWDYFPQTRSGYRVTIGDDNIS